MDEENKDGTKFENNKKLFYVNWEKVIEDFIEFSIHLMKVRYQRDEITSFQIKTLKKKTSQFKKNKFVQDSFKHIFSDLQVKEIDRTLSQVYELFLYYNMFKKIKEQLIHNIGLEAVYPDTEIFLMLLERQIGKKNVNEFIIFEDFVHCLEHYDDEEITGISSYVVGDLCVSLFGKEEYLKLFKEIMRADEMKLPYYPLTEQEKNISQQDVEKIIEEMEKIRKKELMHEKKYFVTKEAPRQISDFIKMLRTKFYFVPSLDPYYEAYCKDDGLDKTLKEVEKGHLSRFDLFGSVFCTWELSLCDYYKISIGKELWKDITDCRMKYRLHTLKDEVLGKKAISM